MKPTIPAPLVRIGLAVTLAAWGLAASAEQSTAELAKAAQNPVADMISLPFQNNTNFNVGPLEKTQNVLNIQPVIPFGVSDNWNIITRTIVPVVSQPATFAGQDRENGLGDTTFTAFLSPKKPGEWIWGVGPVALLPTSTDDRLGTGSWGLGPSAVLLTMRGPWVVGSLFSQVWSIGASDADEVSSFTWQYFVNYNLPEGWYLTSSPVITADWKASGDDRWTIPFGGGFGRIFKIGKQPMNAQVQAFYNADKPRDGADWTLRMQLQFLFPK